MHPILPRFALAAALVIGGLHGIGAQTVPPDPNATLRAELEAIAAEIRLTEERQRELATEMAAIDRDRADLNNALIGTNQRVQALEAEIAAAEARLAGLIGDETRLRVSLAERHDVLAQVLAILQRMGRATPPAILVQPGDALAAVRSAILLGGVVPELRAEAEALATDIEDLVALRAEQETERDRLVTNGRNLAEEEQRLALLIAERQQSLNLAADALAAEEARAAELAARAGNLEELIGVVAAAAPAERGPEMAYADPGRPAGEAGPPVILGEADRIMPARPFSTIRGRLPRPATGELVTAFGADDGFGGRTQGIAVATRPSARISSPADGWVEFAAPYRSYGNILIIDVGGGYRILLSGMERIDVQVGQFVLAGEPVAAMAATQIAAGDAAILGTEGPVLYVEFRRDGAAIDPGPWWAEPY
jgi:septal ring factor EnvC (AmiA/AmiB activator)